MDIHWFLDILMYTPVESVFSPIPVAAMCASGMSPWAKEGDIVNSQS